MNARCKYRIISSLSIVIGLWLTTGLSFGQNIDEINILMDDPELIQKTLNNTNFSQPQAGLRDLDFSFQMIAYAEYDPYDYSAVWHPTEGSRGLCAGSDLDGDGHQEIFAVHYGNGSGVVGFEMNDSGTLEMIWNSVLTPTTYNLGTRFVQTGDLDGDGYGEIVFFRGKYSDDPNRGLYIYEWDGTNDGYELAYHNPLLSLSGDLVSDMVIEHFLLEDVDDDGTTELIFANNGLSMGLDRSEDFFSILSIAGDIGSGSEILTEEYWISPRDVDRDGVIEDGLGGGSGLNVQVCDTDGDGLKEVFCHPYNYFNMFFFEARGPDTYSLGDTTNIQFTYPDDNAQLMNAAVSDMDGDGDDEIYIANYVTGDVYMIQDTDGEATSLLESEVTVLGENVGAQFGALAFDFDTSGTDEIYFGSSAVFGADIRVWDGEEFSSYQSDAESDGFLPKMDVADMNGNGIPELITAHQMVSNYPQRIIRVLEYLPDDPSNSRWAFTPVYNVGYTDDWGNSYAPILGDYNNDGNIDVFVTNGGDQRNFLYQNSGLGYFQRIWEGEIYWDQNWSNTASWGDYDNDGALDLFVANGGDGEANALYHNLGDGTFQRIYEGSIASEVNSSRSASWGDYDNDGYLDLYVGNSSDPNGTNSLYQNNGDGSFSAVSVGWIVFDDDESGSVSWCDYDNDGDLDMYVANCGQNSMYRNEGEGSFTKIQTGVLVAHDDCSQGASWADYDNDGDFDVLVTSGDDHSNRLYQNQGEGVFVEITEGAIVTDNSNSWGSTWADLDNDGDLDLFVVNSAEPDPRDNFIYTNNGEGSFTGVYDNLLNQNDLIPLGCAWGDYNNDGAIDLFIGIDGGQNRLYANQGNSNSWVNIKCVGTASNRSAIGAKVRVKANIYDLDTWQVNEISGQTGAFGQNSLNAEFGLGNADLIDSLRIEWPSGMINEYTDIQVDEFYVIQEGPALQVSADTLAWGEVYLGSANALALELSNLGPASIQVENVSIDNSVFTADLTSLQIEPGTSSALSITFEPTATGYFEGLLTFTSSDPLAPNDSIVLSGQAILAPDIAVSPDSVMVTLLPGATHTQTITIDNISGESTLHWTAHLEIDDMTRTVTFTKDDFALWGQPENQDRITDNVWITRANNQGIFNAAVESNYDYDVSPWDTEWAYGYSEDLEPEDYGIWRDAIDAYPPGMIDQPLSVHLISDDIYLDVLFHSWTSGGNGGGFSYTRIATSPEWIKLSSEMESLDIGESVSIELLLDALEMPAGTHIAEVLISSNDPDEPEIIIPVEMEVSIAPDIYLENDTLLFGNVFNGYSDTLAIPIENWGSAGLVVTDASVDLAEYGVSTQSFEVLPDEIYMLEVILTPSSAGDYSGVLTLTTSDPDEEFFTITLLGSSVDPPIVGVDPDSLYAALLTDETLGQNMIISNTGLSELNYEIRSISVENFSRVRAAPDISLLTGPRYSWDEFFGENLHELNRNEWGRSGKPGPQANTPNTANEVNLRELRESWELLYTDPEEFGPVDVQHVYGSMTSDEVLVKIEGYTEFDEMVYAVYIDIDQNMDTGLDTEEDELGWYLGIDYAMISTGWGFDGFFLVDEESQDLVWLDSLTTNIFGTNSTERTIGADISYFEGVAAFNFAIICDEGIEDMVPDFGSGHITFQLGTPWLAFEPEMGSIGAGQQEDISVTFDAADMFGGEYYSQITVQSNDPESPEITASAHLSVTGVPNIQIAEEDLSFGDIFVNYESELEFEVQNTGTDSLHINSISSDNPVFIVSPTALDIHHSESAFISVRISPDAVGEYDGTISLLSDDPDNGNLSLEVNANALIAPEIGINQNSLVHNVFGSVEVRDTLIVSNTGGSDLAYFIHIEELGETRDAGGPDAFGYSWKDSNEPGGSEYEWIEASGGEQFFLYDDDFVSEVPLGFEFEYYGIPYNNINIMSNGWLSFSSTSSWFPDAVPYYFAGEFDGAIAPFGGDLFPPEGQIYVLQTGSAPDRQTIIEYNHVSWCCSGPPFMTFQVIFYERTNRIRFQYQDLSGNYPQSLGISNEDNSIGIGNGGFDDTYINPSIVSDNYAIEFSSQIDWVSVDPLAGTIPAGMSETLAILIDATNLENGSYEAQLTFDSNDPELPRTAIPVLVYLQGVSVHGDGLLPDSYTLEQNYPNPFNPTTTIRYGLPESSDVSLYIYDIKGRVVQQYTVEDQAAGWVDIEWNGTNSWGERVSTGVYLCRLEAGNYTKTIKMVYLK
ncbi:MAG: VCBS repeat-containing protein [Candidatus Marinimicrobia bacterium]|nr:VCBS repeat-containing protein [Candidatus Neomarinimicrobiota bacterium]